MNIENKPVPAVGLTGGIGSGKSLVAGFFEQGGALVLFADVVAKEVLWHDKSVHEQVIAEFGADICDGNGIIRKEKLAVIAFESRESIERLNAIIHPATIKKIQETIDDVRDSGSYRLVVVEAALIFEAGIAGMFDYIVSVVAPEKMRIDRIVSRDNVPETAVRQRMVLQVNEQEHREKADFILENDGTIIELEHKTGRLIDTILGDYRSRMVQN